MPGHTDILDQPEPLKGSLFGSLAMHGALVGAFVAYSIVGPMHKGPTFGDPHGGAMGSVEVSPVSTIPLPQRAAPKNPVANETESNVPTPPPKARPEPKAVKPPPKDAIALKSLTKDTLNRPDPDFSARNKFREQQQYKPNQVYSNAGQALSSPMFAKPGAGGIGIGNNSPFGTQFGDYAMQVQRKVANNWSTGDVDARLSTAPIVAVTFTIRRDGSVPQNSVRVKQSSGNLALDLSAQRAVLNASPFPPLPNGFARDSADVELRFELRR